MGFSIVVKENGEEKYEIPVKDTQIHNWNSNKIPVTSRKLHLQLLNEVKERGLAGMNNSTDVENLENLIGKLNFEMFLEDNPVFRYFECAEKDFDLSYYHLKLDLWKYGASTIVKVFDTLAKINEEFDGEDDDDGTVPVTKPIVSINGEVKRENGERASFNWHSRGLTEREVKMIINNKDKKKYTFYVDVTVDYNFK